MQPDSQIVLIKNLLELSESSNRWQMLQPIPPYIHTNENVLPKLTQEELQQNLQEYDWALQVK